MERQKFQMASTNSNYCLFVWNGNQWKHRWSVSCIEPGTTKQQPACAASQKVFNQHNPSAASSPLVMRTKHPEVSWHVTTTQDHRNLCFHDIRPNSVKDWKFSGVTWYFMHHRRHNYGLKWPKHYRSQMYSQSHLITHQDEFLQEFYNQSVEVPWGSHEGPSSGDQSQSIPELQYTC